MNISNQNVNATGNLIKAYQDQIADQVKTKQKNLTQETGTNNQPTNELKAQTANNTEKANNNNTVQNNETAAVYGNRGEQNKNANANEINILA